MLILISEAKLNEAYHQPIYAKTDTFSHTWGTNGEIYCAARSELLRFQSIFSRGDILPTEGEQLTCLTISKNHVIAGVAGGKINFYSKDTSKLIHTIKVDPLDIITICYLNDFKTIVVGTELGSMYSIIIDKYDDPSTNEEAIASQSTKIRLVSIVVM